MALHGYLVVRGRECQSRRRKSRRWYILTRNQSFVTSTAPGKPVAHCWTKVGTFQANTRQWTNVGSMLAHRLRRWANIDPTLVEYLVFARLAQHWFKLTRPWVIAGVSEYCFTSLSAQLWQYRDRRKPEAGTMPYSYRMTSRVLYSEQYHR